MQNIMSHEIREERVEKVIYLAQVSEHEARPAEEYETGLNSPPVEMP